MKKTLLILVGAAMTFQIVQCSSIVSAINPKARACRAACDVAYDKCIERAANSEAKKAACRVVRDKCYSHCN